MKVYSTTQEIKNKIYEKDAANVKGEILNQIFSQCNYKKTIDCFLQHLPTLAKHQNSLYGFMSDYINISPPRGLQIAIYKLAQIKFNENQPQCYKINLTFEELILEIKKHHHLLNDVGIKSLLKIYESQQGFSKYIHNSIKNHRTRNFLNSNYSYYKGVQKTHIKSGNYSIGFSNDSYFFGKAFEENNTSYQGELIFANGDVLRGCVTTRKNPLREIIQTSLNYQFAHHPDMNPESTFSSWPQVFRLLQENEFTGKMNFSLQDGGKLRTLNFYKGSIAHAEYTEDTQKFLNSPKKYLISPTQTPGAGVMEPLALAGDFLYKGKFFTTDQGKHAVLHGRGVLLKTSGNETKKYKGIFKNGHFYEGVCRVQINTFVTRETWWEGQRTQIQGSIKGRKIFCKRSFLSPSLTQGDEKSLHEKQTSEEPL